MKTAIVSDADSHGPGEGASPRAVAACLLVALLLTALPAWPGEEPDAAIPVLTADDIPARIAGAMVGEWVLYRLAGGDHSRLTVIEKTKVGTDTQLVIRNEITKPGRRKKTPPKISEERILVSEAVADLKRLEGEDFVTASEILVMGRKVDAVVINYVEDGEVIRQSYLSGNIPVYGLARGVNAKAKDKTALTLIDFGFPDE